MRFHLTPRPLLHLITAVLLTPHPSVLANPAPAPSLQAGFSFNELFARYDCSGTYCGFSSQLCCTSASTCYTDSNSQAQCGAGSTYATTAAAAGGYWQYYTTTYVQTDLATMTEVVSSYIAAATTVAVAATATATLSCNFALNEIECGTICCASNQYCYASGQCAANANGASSGYYSTYTTPGATTTTVGVVAASAPLAPTSSALSTVTTTRSPTTTIPFETPVATGANITLTSQQQESSGGLSGGAIAGIVIGVLLGLFLLALLCFCCCAKGLWDTIFGRRKSNRRVTEVEEYERRSHHASGGGGRRTWYGAMQPARVSRYDERRSDGRSNKGKEALGIGAGLAALWAILGLKRRRDERRNEEKTEYSEYSSDYYTSASESRRSV